MAKQFSEAMKMIEEMTPEEKMERLRQRTQARVDEYNSASGNLDKDDGYNCPLCKNRGNIAFLEQRNGSWYEKYPQCRCMEIRQSIHRMRNSGLESSIRNCTFERFETDTEWKKAMLSTAKTFLSDGAPKGQWLFIGGAVGSGKTHICTAVARQLLYETPVHYMIWSSESTKLKSIINDDEEYGREISRLKNVSVLYIDDFFKPVKDEHGNTRPPTPADVRLAYEILNHRYANRMVTIISSERYLSELMDIDEAIASRIAERAKGFCLAIGRDRSKNHRLSAENLL